MEEWILNLIRTDYPLFFKVVVIYLMTQIGCKMAAGFFFGIAANIGRIQSSNRRWVISIGKASWKLALFFHAFGFGISKRYLEAQYVKRTDDSRK